MEQIAEKDIEEILMKKNIEEENKRAFACLSAGEIIRGALFEAFGQKEQGVSI